MWHVMACLNIDNVNNDAISTILTSTFTNLVLFFHFMNYIRTLNYNSYLRIPTSGCGLEDVASLYNPIKSRLKLSAEQSDSRQLLKGGGQ